MQEIPVGVVSINGKNKYITKFGGYGGKIKFLLTRESNLHYQYYQLPSYLKLMELLEKSESEFKNTSVYFDRLTSLLFIHNDIWDEPNDNISNTIIHFGTLI